MKSLKYDQGLLTKILQQKIPFSQPAGTAASMYGSIGPAAGRTKMTITEKMRAGIMRFFLIGSCSLKASYI
ncbi:MAG: hypothetical protein U2P59_09305 [Synergistota bacterium]|nr:hypothetical protein [Synergistota bacterium]